MPSEGGNETVCVLHHVHGLSPLENCRPPPNAFVSHLHSVEGSGETTLPQLF